MRTRVVFLGALIVGVIDLVFAILYWIQLVSPIRIFQSIAAGLLGGKASRDGGIATAILGGVLHFAIATAMAFTYALAARKLPVLVRQPTLFGLVYGVLLYLAMNLVVLPLSARGMPSFADHAWVASSVAMHAVFGLIIAHTARIALRA